MAGSTWPGRASLPDVSGPPAAASKAIVQRADGMPLYAVETVRMLLAEGRLAMEDGVYHPVGDLTSLAVPETLTALIASRLDGLAPEDRVELAAEAATPTRTTQRVSAPAS